MWMFIADLHFRKETLERHAPTIQWLKAQFDTLQPSHVIFLGDTTNHRDIVSWDTLHAVVNGFLGYMEKASWQPEIHLLVGNHDMNDREDRTVNSASIISEGCAHITAYPEITQVTIENTEVLFIPYHADQSQIAAHLAKVYPTKESRQGIIVCAHLSLHGAHMNCSGRIYEGTDITTQTLFGFHRVFMGHFHRHATYGPDDFVMYVGDPVQLSFGESGDLQKGYVEYDPKTSYRQLICNPHAEQYVRLSVEEAQRAVESVDSSLAGKLVQIRNESKTDRHHIDSLRKALQTTLSVRGITSLPEAPLRPKPSKCAVDADDQLSGNDLLAYVREFVQTQSNWRSPDKSVQYIAEKEKAIRTSKAADPESKSLRSSFVASLSKVTMTNFLGIRGVRELDLVNDITPGMWLVQGDNGAGKTTIAEAILWCLYGICGRADHIAERKVVNQVIHSECKSCDVEITFTNGFTVHRHRGLPNKSRLWFRMSDGTTVEKGNVQTTQEELEQILGVDANAFRSTIILTANQSISFASSNDARRKLVDDLLGFANLDQYAKLISEDFSTMSSQVRTMTSECAQLNGQHDMTFLFLNKRLAELESKRRDMAESTQSLARLRDALVAGRLKLNAAQQERRTSALQMASLEHEISIIRTRQTELKDRLREAQSNSERLVEKYSRATRTALMRVIHLASMIEKHGDCLKQTQACQETIDRLRDEIRKATEERQKLLADLEELSRSADTVQEALSIAEAIPMDVPKVQDETIPDLHTILRIRSIVGSKLAHLETVEADMDGEYIWSAFISSVETLALINKTVDAYLDERHGGDQGDRHEVSKSLIEHQSNINRLRSDFRSLGNRRNGLVNGIHESEKRLLRMENDVQNQISTQKARKGDVLSDADLATTRAEMSTLIAEHGLEVSNLNDLKTHLTLVLETHVRATASHHPDVVQLETLIQATQEHLVELQGRMTVTLKNQTDWKRRLTAAEEDLKTSELTVRSLDREHDKTTERLEVMRKDLQYVEGVAKRDEQDLERLRSEKAKLEIALRETEAAFDIVAKWTKAWKSSFRAFCLQKNVDQINERFLDNILLLNRDSDGTNAQELLCKLDADLRLVEYGSGLSVYKMSDGQRRRMYLALFFAIFEIAQTRSSFQPRVLFLDEISDSLDAAGRQAVQRWVSDYANGNSDSHVFVVTHAPPQTGFFDKQTGVIHVRLGEQGSMYEVQRAGRIVRGA